MADFRQVFSIDNDVFKAYAFYAAILGLKMYGVTFATTYHRFTKKVFANPEDATTPGSKVGNHPEVERARRAHRNDLENIVPFWTLGLLFVATQPSLAVATMCYRLFTYSRIAHSFIYILHVPQPARALSFLVGVAVNLYMGYKVVSQFY